jgi:inorganic pyrophosphatase
MKIAVYSNSRTAFKAMSSLAEAFKVAYRAGCVMGFFLTAAGLLVLVILIGVYRAIYGQFSSGNLHELPGMMECIAGYGLGGSTVALFGRVGGGIYTKAADVGADLVGKVENAFKEDSPKNPATIADNVGDNVGDIAGMGSDLFGSFAEATSAALAISASAPSMYMI